MAELDYPIEEIRGIAGSEAKALRDAGCGTTPAFLTAAAGRADRTALAQKTGVAAETVLKLANRADLMRVRGIGTKWGDLLEHAGIDTVKELATRRPENLHAKLKESNGAKSIVQALPNAGDCAGWVDQAKGLEPRLTY